MIEKEIILQVVEHFENMTIESINDNLNGIGDSCWIALEEHLKLCLEIRLEMNNINEGSTIYDLLNLHGMSLNMIQQFKKNILTHKDDESCPGW